MALVTYAVFYGDSTNGSESSYVRTIDTGADIGSSIDYATVASAIEAELLPLKDESFRGYKIVQAIPDFGILFTKEDGTLIVTETINAIIKE